MLASLSKFSLFYMLITYYVQTFCYLSTTTWVLHKSLVAFLIYVPSFSNHIFFTEGFSNLDY